MFRYSRLKADLDISSRRVKSLTQFVCLAVVLVHLNLTHANAQDNGLNELLDLYPQESSRDDGELALFSADTKLKIADVSSTSDYDVIRDLGRWKVIRFKQPTVPLWISKAYVTVQGESAVVDSERLNARSEPSLEAPVVAIVTRNFQSKVLDAQGGFIKVLGPASTEVAIAADTTEANNSNWSYEPRQGDRAAELQSSKRAAVNESVSPDVRSKEVASKASIADTSLNVNANTLDAESDRSTETRQARQHLIAPGDAISLTVFGERDLSAENLRVPENGLVSLPLIGSVSVVGKTTADVEESVRQTLAEGYVKNPRVSVTIFSYRPIFIRGAVVGTGSFPYTEGLTVAKAIALAGGSKNSAKANGVSILRDGETVETGLNLSSQYQVASGDVITIEEELGVGEDPTLFIYLHGEVASPGEYLFRRGLTIEKAIVLAGGFTLRASTKKIQLTRYDGIEVGDEPVKFKKVKLHTAVKPGDVINVGASWF